MTRICRFVSCRKHICLKCCWSRILTRIWAVDYANHSTDCCLNSCRENIPLLLIMLPQSCLSTVVLGTSYCDIIIGHWRGAFRYFAHSTWCTLFFFTNTPWPWAKFRNFVSYSNVRYVFEHMSGPIGWNLSPLIYINAHHYFWATSCI